MVVQLVASDEDETERYSQRAKSLRYRDDVWWERGQRDAKLLMHRKTGKFRCLLRQENTRTVACNFCVMSVASYCGLEPCPNSDRRTWLFAAFDCSEGGPQAVQLALVFASIKLAVKLWNAFEEAEALMWPRVPRRSHVPRVCGYAHRSPESEFVEWVASLCDAQVLWRVFDRICGLTKALFSIFSSHGLF